MNIRWREHQFAFRRNGHALGDRPHLHNAIVHRHLVDLGLARKRGIGRDEAIMRIAVIGYGEIAYANIGTLGLCARPCILDRNGPRLHVLSGCCAGKKKQHGDRQCEEHANFLSGDHLPTADFPSSRWSPRLRPKPAKNSP